MRISTANTYEIGVSTLQRRQSDLAEIQAGLTSGKRVNRASDDPVAAARAERALMAEARVVASERSVQAAKTIMIQTESALGDASELVQQARETLVAAGNATYSDTERKGLTEKLKQIRDQLLQVANRSDGAGTFLFGGQGSSLPPFIDSRPDNTLPPEQTGVRYVGNRGSSTTDSSTNLPLALDGASVWTSARTGNGVFETRSASVTQGAWIDNGQVVDPSQITGDSYSLVYNATTQAFDITNTTTGATLPPEPFVSGQTIERDGMSFIIKGTPTAGETFEIVPSTSTLNMFGTLDKAVADLTSGKTGAGLSQDSADNLRNIDSVLGRLLSARTVAGEAMARVDNESDRLATQKLNHQTERANAEDLDMIDALSQFQNKQSGYDAALKSYSMVQRMSLFQYLNV